MKKTILKTPLTRSLTFMLFVLLALGACKSKKKIVEAEPEPVPVEESAPEPEPEPEEPSAEEVAVGKLEHYFNAVADATNVQSANNTIREALGMFSNQDVPVLVVIHEESGVKDYDEPTTINKYLHYLKDTKKNLNFISDIRMDGSGNVTELELRRR
ncbi:MAG: nucleoid-structuring protein H-NS [Cyclobacteriaceae bacterium]